MWLHDSSAQVWLYLQLADKDESLKKLLKGVIAKQTEFVLLYPYANAFYNDPALISEWKNDLTTMKLGVNEHKWEIVSHCYVLRLAYDFWIKTGYISVFSNKWRKS